MAASFACPDDAILSEWLVAKFENVLEGIHPGDDFATIDHGRADEVPPLLCLFTSHPSRRIHTLRRRKKHFIICAAPLGHGGDHLFRGVLVCLICVEDGSKETAGDVRFLREEITAAC